MVGSIPPLGIFGGSIEFLERGVEVDIVLRGFVEQLRGIGLPPLEAMACGTPVIVSNTSSLPEVVGDAGWLVNPEDVEGLTVAMYRILSDENLRREMRAKGLKRAATFSWDRAARQTIQVYRKVADQ